jgi:hypothetical protein
MVGCKNSQILYYKGLQLSFKQNVLQLFESKHAKFLNVCLGILGLKAKTTFKTTGSTGRFLYIVIKASPNISIRKLLL